MPERGVESDGNESGEGRGVVMLTDVARSFHIFLM